MMDCTDRHDRFFLRLMSKNVMLYTEMVATKSAIHGDRNKILSFSPEEKLNGISETYHQNGQLASKFDYKDGNVVEVLEQYDFNGNPVE